MRNWEQEIQEIFDRFPESAQKAELIALEEEYKKHFKPVQKAYFEYKNVGHLFDQAFSDIQRRENYGF